MYKFIDELKKLYSVKEYDGIKEAEKPLFSQLERNINELSLRFRSSADLTIRRIRLGQRQAAVVNIDNMINKDILALGILKPLLGYGFDGEGDILKTIKEEILFTDDLTEALTFEQLESNIMSGFVGIIVDGLSTALCIGIQGYESRGISEPDSDVVQRGSKEGFVEPLRINISLIRRRIKNPRLHFETMNIGKVSKTEVCLCYLSGVASYGIVARVKKRLKKADINTVLTSGSVAAFLEDRRDISFFRAVGISQRPDTVCGKITEGRIAVIIDGIPSVLVVPYLFSEYFQTLDDYSNRAYFATFTRWLKYCAFFISILLPGLYVSLGTFDPEMFPTLMLNKIAGSIASTPLSLMSETVLILLVYELMRESGLRMPSPLGYAVSIVGGLVVGDTAINAGLIGAPTLMVVAVTAICSYVLPDLYAPCAVLRIIFTVVGGLMGVWGTAVLLCVVLVGICSKNSFGIPFTSPISPFGSVLFRDVIIRAGSRVLSGKTNPVQYMPGSENKEDRS